MENSKPDVHTPAPYAIAAYRGFAQLLSVLVQKEILTHEDAVNICVDAAHPCFRRGEIYSDPTMTAAGKILVEFADLLRQT